MSEITITELEDEPGTVYFIGVGPDVSEPVRSWFYSESFDHQWKERFDEAEKIVAPAGSGIGKVLTMSEEEVKELMEDEQ